MSLQISALLIVKRRLQYTTEVMKHWDLHLEMACAAWTGECNNLPNNQVIVRGGGINPSLTGLGKRRVQVATGLVLCSSNLPVPAREREEEIPLPFLRFLCISTNISTATVPVSYSSAQNARINPGSSAVTTGPKLTEPLQHQRWVGPDTTTAVPPPCPTLFPRVGMMLKDISWKFQ